MRLVPRKKGLLRKFADQQDIILLKFFEFDK